jgi:hypothetical protein
MCIDGTVESSGKLLEGEKMTGKTCICINDKIIYASTIDGSKVAGLSKTDK